MDCLHHDDHAKEICGAGQVLSKLIESGYEITSATTYPRGHGIVMSVYCYDFGHWQDLEKVLRYSGADEILSSHNLRMSRPHRSSLETDFDFVLITPE